MKRAAAIGILLILLFNLCGYRMLADYLQTRAEASLDVSIDEGSYNTEQVIELSVATNLPYSNDWNEWERCNGSIEINGLHYQYIERKLENGNMLYRCLPNPEKINVLAARDEFFSLVNSFNQQHESKKSSTAVVINNFLGDYDEVQLMNLNVQPVTFNKNHSWLPVLANLADAPCLEICQPPDNFS